MSDSDVYRIVSLMGVVFIVLNLVSFLCIVFVYGPRIVAVMRMPESIKQRMLADYDRVDEEDLTV
jgi:hypothetical protein